MLEGLGLQGEGGKGSGPLPRSTSISSTGANCADKCVQEAESIREREGRASERSYLHQGLVRVLEFRRLPPPWSSNASKRRYWSCFPLRGGRVEAIR